MTALQEHTLWQARAEAYRAEARRLQSAAYRADAAGDAQAAETAWQVQDTAWGRVYAAEGACALLAHEEEEVC